MSLRLSAEVKRPGSVHLNIVLCVRVCHSGGLYLLGEDGEPTFLGSALEVRKRSHMYVLDTSAAASHMSQQKH